MAVSPVSGYGLAAASPLTCEVRSNAHVAEHGGLLADSSYHVSHGELPTCDGSQDQARKGGDDNRDNKSRFCRKKWYC
ncbi:hypothetical protein SEA_CHARM_82 [Mycobacterium phage Charm]|nr:hypothetical protein SEA_CHARM_82 [Mycobacterium phage Charm]QGJ88376.1 hypothetical protein SEA_DREAMTEAM1_82 [Mycobacterium phage DreamTeam1]